MKVNNLRHVFFVTRLKTRDVIGKGYVYAPIVYGLEKAIDSISGGDSMAIVEKSTRSEEYHTSHDTAEFLGLRKRDIVTSDSYESTLESFRNLAKKEDPQAIVVIPRDRGLLNVYLERIKKSFSIETDNPKIFCPEYWKAWHLDLTNKSVNTIGYTPSEITSETEYVQGDGHAACYHRDFAIDPKTKTKICVHERYVPDPYGMDDPQY